MKFHLSFPVSALESKLDYSQRILLIGSCFSENIGDLLKKYKFTTQTNPNGILFNPASISTCLRSILDHEQVQEKDLFFANDCWNSWEHHSSFSNPDKALCLENMNANFARHADAIKHTDWLFITFGSAFFYEHINTGKQVANCHKVPQKDFTKRLLSSVEIVKDYKELMLQLRKMNPQLKIVFTISPVRYIRDGVVENNLSKARLIDAVHELVNHDTNSFYFPAYELVVDDLRDYRFYKNDLVHPNEQAIEYVFEKLMAAIFSELTSTVFEKIKDLINAKNHRPFNENGASHLKFKATYLKKCLQIQQEYPFMDLESEIQDFGQ